MKIRIPNSDLIKTHDEVVALANKFNVNATQANDCMHFEGTADDTFSFLTAYHDIDVDAANDDIAKYAINNQRICTPETALQKINDFIIAKGGFEGYDEAYEALHNAIHGLM